MAPIILIWGECFPLLLSSWTEASAIDWPLLVTTSIHVANGISRCHLEIVCDCMCVCFCHVLCCLCVVRIVCVPGVICVVLVLWKRAYMYAFSLGWKLHMPDSEYHCYCNCPQPAQVSESTKTITLH